MIYLQIFLTGLVLFNQVLYIRAISVGRSSSTAVTWLIWSFVNAVMSWTQYKSGNTASAVVIAAYSFGALGSFVYSMKKGRWKLSAVQVACLVISLTALSVAIFSSKVLAISINVSAHFVGTVPIFLLVFARKSREPIECWVIWLVASSSNLLIALYGKELLIAPVYYCVHNIILVSLLLALQTKEKKNINDTV